MRRQRHKAWASIALALGFIMVNAASAESLAGLGLQYKFVSPVSFMTKTPGCSQGSVGLTANCPSITGSVVVNYMAPVDLPEGAQITNMYVWYFNNTTDQQFYYCLLRTGMIFVGTATSSQLSMSQVDSTLEFLSGPGGYTLPSNAWRMATMTPTSNVVINSWNTAYTGKVIYQSYLIQVVLPANNAAVGFNGTLIAYKRQIAPAPTVATYTDVPPTHPFFNEVEQLKKSGITLGCNSDQFCPDSPVTRGQMAAFLSRALGLQWSPPV